MPNILTPLTLWENFNVTEIVQSEVVFTSEKDGVTTERIRLRGRKTEEGRVNIAAAYAYDAKNPAQETILIFPDSKDTIDDALLAMFVKKGYSALMVDYRGEWQSCDFYTEYPPDIYYANFARSGRFYSHVDDNAVKTSWYEWVAVGLFAHKYAMKRGKTEEVAVVGLRDGGEIAWKLGVADKFECIIPICAAGWRAYSGLSKYVSSELDLNEERYRFIAGIDSQAYAPYVRCPVLMLCSTNDEKFDYDRAYDTFSRINPKFAGDSAIAYSVHCNGCIGIKCTNDMFMFLDKYLKNRQVFIPKPSEISVEVDGESNLIARVNFDDQGIVEYCGMYIAEDCLDFPLREWMGCPPKTKISPKEQQFYLNVYEKTSTIFVVCYAKYINGFTVWSRIVAKKLSGKFRNMQAKCKVMYSDKDGRGGFSNALPEKFGIGGLFFLDDSAMPRIVEKADGVKGLYAEGGLTTYRMNNPRYTPNGGSILKMDVFCDKDSVLTLSFFDYNTKEEYTDSYKIIGGVWQSIASECGMFKNISGVPLAKFNSNFIFSIKCGSPYAVNNVMWL